jgi:NADPH:quinone reductase-like Zn-dependent oxidoreductase
MPDAMSFDDAAALPVNYVTAFHILFHVGQLRPFDRVLIHMASGGVGQAAIQLCRLVEGVEIFGTASAKKHAQLREAGVQHPIDYNTQDYAEEVRRVTQGRGVQWVLDPLGGKDWTKGYSLLSPGGRLAAYGWSNMVSGTKRNLFHLAREALSLKRYSPVKLMADNRALIGINMGHMWGEGELIGRHLTALMKLHGEGKIRPVLDKVIPLAQGAEAHNRMQDRLNVGKVLFDCA